MPHIVDLQPAHSLQGLTLSRQTACDDILRANHGLRYMNPPAPAQFTQTQPHHGIKRSAPADEVESSSHISTEFKKLRLNGTRPSNNDIKPTTRSVDGDSISHGGKTLPHACQPGRDLPISPQDPAKRPWVKNQAHDDDDSMPIDDTPHRIYISDLDREIAEIEANESIYDTANGSFFLPDIDKNISKIPLNVLRQNFDTAATTAASSGRAANEQALVLYRDPSSISVPEEEDAVRKAIIAARRNAREKMREDHEFRVNFKENMPDDPAADQDIDCMEIE